jgi:hypothetical protein
MTVDICRCTNNAEMEDLVQENKILVFAGSLRMGSLNRKLAETAARWLENTEPQ